MKDDSEISDSDLRGVAAPLTKIRNLETAGVSEGINY